MRRRERSQTEQLRQALEEREAQLAEANARLAALEGSTSLQVGRALTAAAKSPRRGLTRLPRDLYRLWRGSSGSRHGAGRTAEPVLSYTAERQESRLLTAQPADGDGDGRIVVAGILSAAARAAVHPYARLAPLRPHDAAIVFDSADVDLLLVTASAAAPGGPWSHVGDPAVTDRTRALRWVLESAAARGIPSVLALDVPCPPGLRTLGFDHVHDGDLGVPLHRYHPVATGPERDPVPLWLPGPGVPNGRVTAAVEPLLTAGELRTAPDTGDDPLPHLLRDTATVVTAHPTVALRALACGTRVLLAGAAGAELTDLSGPALRHPATPGDPAALAREVAELRAAGPLDPTELRHTLRTLFLRHATPVRLDALRRAVGVPAPGLGGVGDALGGRRAALLAAPADRTESMTLADDVLNQLHRPSEVVLPRRAGSLAGVDRLRGEGVPLRLVDMPDANADTDGGGGGPDGDETATWARMAAATEAPWVALWRFPSGTAHLADTLCAAECSGADAVGAAVVAWGAEDAEPGTPPVDWSGIDQDYVFVQTVRPDLARRDLVAAATHPGMWTRHGKRSLALSRPASTADVPA